AMTTVAKTVLEENGFKVKYKLGDINPIFSAISRGASDAFLDVWMPVTHQEYMQEYGKSIEVLGVNYENARTGLVVPSYVPSRSIEELNRNNNKFNSRIVGIAIVAGIMKTTEDAIRRYNLDYELTVSTDRAMTDTLQAAIDKQQWIVVTGWTPHWMFSK